MKEKMLALILNVIGVLTIVITRDKFIDLYNTIGHPPESAFVRYLVIVGQGLFYFLLSAVTILFGILQLLKANKQKLKVVRTTFFVLLTIWFVLEIPIYKCDYYEVDHSFWEAKQGHFH